MPTTVVNLHGVGPSACDVYIGRQTRHYRLGRSVWANPFKIGPDGDRAEVMAKYRAYILGRPDLLAHLPELRGKKLGCWCAPEPCHGHILAELADQEAS